MKHHNAITAIILASPDWFNTEAKISKCLDSVAWADKKLILTSKITTPFENFAKEYKAELKLQKGKTFADWRNHAAELTDTNWMFYIDPDEQVTPQLRREIMYTIDKPTEHSAYAIPRTNIILGKPMKHGGWWPDYVVRLIYKPDLIEWRGDLHEQPKVSGPISYLKHPLLHYKHERLEEMLDKTIQWSSTEAQLMFQSNHPPMNPRRFIRPMFTEVFKRLILKKGISDGAEGVIDGLYQGFSRFISYAQLWEMQQTQKNEKAENQSGIIWTPRDSKTKQHG